MVEKNYEQLLTSCVWCVAALHRSYARERALRLPELRLTLTSVSTYLGFRVCAVIQQE